MIFKYLGPFQHSSCSFFFAAALLSQYILPIWIFQWYTLQGINISHLGKRKIIFKMPFLGDMLVPWRVIPKGYSYQTITVLIVRLTKVAGICPVLDNKSPTNDTKTWNLRYFPSVVLVKDFFRHYLGEILIPIVHSSTFLGWVRLNHHTRFFIGGCSPNWCKPCLLSCPSFFHFGWI